MDDQVPALQALQERAATPDHIPALQFKGGGINTFTAAAARAIFTLLARTEAEIANDDVASEGAVT